MHHGAMMMSAQDARDVIDTPTPPSNLVATANGPDQIDVTWVDNSDNEDHFVVEWSLGTGTFSAVGSKVVVADSTSTSITGLLSETTYSVRVYGVNAAGDGGDSNQDSATTDPDVPDAPSNNGALADSPTQITQTWTDNSHNEDNFRAQIATDSGFSNIVGNSSVSANTEEKVWTGLSESTTYWLRVRAENATGDSAWSNSAVVSTPSSSPTPPDAPSSNTATTNSSSQITQSWVDNSDNEDNFRVQRATDSGFTENVVSDTRSPNITSMVWSGLDPNVQYYFRVRAENASGNSAWSNTDTATTDPSAVPDTPTGHSASADSATRITQSWSDVDQEDEYEVQRADDSGFTQNVVSDTLAPGTTSKQWTGLAEGTQYYFRVRATNSLGSSAWNSTNARTQLATPLGMSGQVFDEGLPTEWVRLSWSDQSVQEQNYEVHRDGALYDTIAANSEQYDVSNPNHTGTWKVRAVHSIIPDSDFSGTHTVS